jgi:hypothetical protein
MSCLFNSLSAFIPQDPFTVRQIICDYLQENKPIIDGIDTRYILSLEHPSYIQHMRNPSTWGGAIEIQCACRIWNIGIHVYNQRDKDGRKIEFIPTGEPERVIELYWTGGHYEPIR